MSTAIFKQRPARLSLQGRVATWVVVLATSLASILPGCSSDDSTNVDPVSPYASLQITPSIQGFGTEPVGAGGTPSTFTVVNTGTALSSTLSAYTALQTTTLDAGVQPFVITDDHCTGRILGPGASCTVDVHFTPEVTGLALGLLNIQSGPEMIWTASTAGIGGPAGTPSFAIGPSSVTFGSVEVGGSSPSQTQNVFVVNASRDPLAALTVSVGGPQADGFAVTGDSCTGQGLASGATCYLSLGFVPETTGASFAASLAVTSGGVTVTAPLTGASNPPAELVLTPAIANFGACSVGLPCGAPQTFTLTNEGDTTSGNVDVAISGADAADFTFVTNGCVLAFLGPAASCSFQVAFTPGGAGPRTATITTSGSPHPPTTTLTGTGMGTGDDAGSDPDAN